LTQKLGFELVEFDYENVWEWTISSFDGYKLDICRDHTESRLKTFTNIFRIDQNKEPFADDLLEKIISKLKDIGVTPIYVGKLWINKDEVFEYETFKTIK
jgi:hypothetical protein